MVTFCLVHTNHTTHSADLCPDHSQVSFLNANFVSDLQQLFHQGVGVSEGWVLTVTTHTHTQPQEQTVCHNLVAMATHSRALGHFIDGYAGSWERVWPMDGDL